MLNEYKESRRQSRPYGHRAVKTASNFNRRQDSVAPSSTDQQVAESKAVFAFMARMIFYRSTDT